MEPCIVLPPRSSPARNLGGTEAGKSRRQIVAISRTKRPQQSGSLRIVSAQHAKQRVALRSLAPGALHDAGLRTEAYVLRFAIQAFRRKKPPLARGKFESKSRCVKQLSAFKRV